MKLYLRKFWAILLASGLPQLFAALILVLILNFIPLSCGKIIFYSFAGIMGIIAFPTIIILIYFYIMNIIKTWKETK